LPLLLYCKRAIIFGRTATIQFFTQKCNMIAVYDCNIGTIEYAGKMLGMRMMLRDYSYCTISN